MFYEKKKIQHLKEEEKIMFSQTHKTQKKTHTQSNGNFHLKHLFVLL